MPDLGAPRATPTLHCGVCVCVCVCVCVHVCVTYTLLILTLSQNFLSYTIAALFSVLLCLQIYTLPTLPPQPKTD